MSDEFDQPGGDREGRGWESVLNRCRVLAAKIANELRNKRPEHVLYQSYDEFVRSILPLRFDEYDRNIHRLRRYRYRHERRVVDGSARRMIGWPSIAMSNFMPVNKLIGHVKYLECIIVYDGDLTTTFEEASAAKTIWMLGTSWRSLRS